MKCVIDVYLRNDTRYGTMQRASRVHVKPVDFEQIVGSCFDQTRQYIATDRNVALHAMSVLAELAPVSQNLSRRRLLIDQMKKLAAACDATLKDPTLADEIRQRFTDAQALISDDGLAYQARNSRNWFGGSA